MSCKECKRFRWHKFIFCFLAVCFFVFLLFSMERFEQLANLSWEPSTGALSDFDVSQQLPEDIEKYGEKIWENRRKWKEAVAKYWEAAQFMHRFVGSHATICHVWSVETFIDFASLWAFHESIERSFLWKCLWRKTSRVFFTCARHARHSRAPVDLVSSHNQGLNDPRFQHLFQPSLCTLEHMMLLCQPASFTMLLEGSPSSLKPKGMAAWRQQAICCNLHCGSNH